MSPFSNLLGPISALMCEPLLPRVVGKFIAPPIASTHRKPGLSGENCNVDPLAIQTGRLPGIGLPLTIPLQEAPTQATQVCSLKNRLGPVAVISKAAV